MGEFAGGHGNDQAMDHPSKSCEHHFSSHLRGGTGFFIPQCTLCGAFDWDDVATQLAQIRAEAWERGYMHAFNTERGKPADQPCPDHLRDDLNEWNPYLASTGGES